MCKFFTYEIAYWLRVLQWRTGRLNERNQTMLRTNSRKIQAIRKNFQKRRKTWVHHAKFPISQIFVSKQMNNYSSMNRKMPMPSKISTPTYNRSQNTWDKLKYSCEIRKYGEVLICFFQQFFASINIFISGGGMSTRL